MAQNTKKNPPAKPATKLPPTTHAKPASAPVTKVEDLDDEDLDLDDGADEGSNGANGKGANWKDTMKLPPAKRMAVRLGNLVDRVQHQLDAMKSWAGEDQEAARAIVQQAQDGLKGAAERLAQVPDDWRPRRAAGGGGGSKVELQPDDLVRITDKRMAEYTDIVSAECARGIKVVEVRGNKVVGLMSDGVRAMLPRGHVTLDTEATEAAKAASAS